MQPAKPTAPAAWRIRTLVLRTYPYASGATVTAAPPVCSAGGPTRTGSGFVGLLLGEPPSAVNVLRIVLEALDVGLHDIRGEVVDQRNDRDTLHRDPFSLVQ